MLYNIVSIPMPRVNQPKNPKPTKKSPVETYYRKEKKSIYTRLNNRSNDFELNLILVYDKYLKYQLFKLRQRQRQRSSCVLRSVNVF